MHHTKTKPATPPAAPPRLSRRAWLQSAAALAALSITPPAPAQSPRPAPQPRTPGARPRLCVFSKHLPALDFKALGDYCAPLGLEIDLTVREGGHIAPATVRDQLPAAVEAIRTAGTDVAMITTRINDPDSPHVDAIFDAARAAGLTYIRIDGLRYPDDTPIPETLARITTRLCTLSKHATTYNLQLGYHNHSGPKYFAAPLWDLYQVIQECGPESALGANLDAGHTTVEGAYGAWQTNVRLLAPHTRMMAVKDFLWDRAKPKWVPLGTGIVPLQEILQIMANARFGGPISMHFEYKIDGLDAMKAEIAAATQHMQRLINDLWPAPTTP